MEADKHALIDELAPAYDMVERHQTDVHAPVDRVYDAVRNLELTGSRTIRWLFLLRELPASLRLVGRGNKRLGLTLDALLRSGFLLLGEKPQQEILLGLVGRFWAPSGGIQWLDADGFRCFSRSGYAKATWNFTLFKQQDHGTTRLATETRVFCLDDESRRRFRLYWLFVGPFSSLIRRKILRSIKHEAERSPTLPDSEAS